MALGFIAALFGPRIRLPRDRATRVPRSAKKAAKPHITAMLKAVSDISGLPGIADIKQTKRLPKGFFELAEKYLSHYDAYAAIVQKYLPLDDAKQPGQPGGCDACYAAPMGLSGVETLNLYRKVRPRRDFARLGPRLGELGEQQFKDIQAVHTGKDPEKIRMGGRAVQAGRLAFARRKQACPFLDEQASRCRIWDDRPIACRMHFVTKSLDPTDDAYPKGVQAHNVRPPIKVQLALAQLDKRLALDLSPFLYAGLLQLLQLNDGQLLQEVGEAPRRMQQDGSIAQRANRNVRHAKKYKKKPKRRK